MKQLSRLAVPREVVVLEASESAATLGGTDIILSLPEWTVAVALAQVTVAARRWVAKMIFD
jgi:hypothetical protein